MTFKPEKKKNSEEKIHYLPVFSPIQMAPDTSIEISIQSSKRHRFHWQMAEDRLMDMKEIEEIEIEIR